MNGQTLGRRGTQEEEGNDEGRGEQRVIWCVTKRGNTEKVVSVPGVRATAVSGRPDSEVREGNNVHPLLWESVRRFSRHQLRISLVAAFSSFFYMYNFQGR